MRALAQAPPAMSVPASTLVHTVGRLEDPPSLSRVTNEILRAAAAVIVARSILPAARIADAKQNLGGPPGLLAVAEPLQSERSLMLIPGCVNRCGP